jgi:hypothetical protein
MKEEKLGVDLLLSFLSNNGFDIEYKFASDRQFTMAR